MSTPSSSPRSGASSPPARFSPLSLYRSPKTHTRSRVSAFGIAFVVGASPASSGSSSPSSAAPPRALLPPDGPPRVGRRGGTPPAGSTDAAHPAAVGLGRGPAPRLVLVDDGCGEYRCCSSSAKS
ncbi:hypothetical protein VPH35_047108 [Triticum aestivum]